MAKKKRMTREEIVEELLRTDPNFRKLKERIDYYERRLAERRASS
jgi:hypothetical protein